MSRFQYFNLLFFTIVKIVSFAEENPLNIWRSLPNPDIPKSRVNNNSITFYTSISQLRLIIIEFKKLGIFAF